MAALAVERAGAEGSDGELARVHPLRHALRPGPGRHSWSGSARRSVLPDISRCSIGRRVGVIILLDPLERGEAAQSPSDWLFTLPVLDPGRQAVRSRSCAPPGA